MSEHPLAKELNATLEHDFPAAFSLLSKRGREIYFPKTGILGQTAEAKGVKYNATIGIALNDDGSPMALPSMREQIPLSAQDVYPYAPSFGKPELRERWKQLLYEKNRSLKAPVSLPVVAAGITHSLSVAGYLFADPKDEILITDKHWDNCSLIYEHTYDARLQVFNTFTDTGFDTDAFQDALMEGEARKRIVLLNFPNNPSGYTPTKNEAKRIVDVIRASGAIGNRIAVILDDAYFGLAYGDDVNAESLMGPLAEAHDNVLVCKVDGATKEDCVWGHRVGFVTYAGKGMTPAAAKALEAKTAGAVRAVISNAPHVSQSSLLALYASPTYGQEKKELFDVMKRRFERVRAVLQEPKYARFFRALPFNSGYFLCVELQEGLNADVVRKRLLNEFDTGVIALGPLLRIAFSSLPEEDIPVCFENIYQACAAVHAETTAARPLASVTA